MLYPNITQLNPSLYLHLSSHLISSWLLNSTKPSMTKTVLIFSTKLSLLILLLSVFVISSQSKLGNLKETSFTVFFQNRPSGPKATSIAIAGIPGQDWTYGKFGTAFATDATMTEGFDRRTAEIGRGQGMFLTSAKDGTSLTLLLSIVFTGKEYKGSTLQIQGADHQFENPREVAVVGGTGQFRSARGYATFESFRVSKSHVVSRCNVTIEHY